MNITKKKALLTYSVFKVKSFLYAMENSPGFQRFKANKEAEGAKAGREVPTREESQPENKK